MKNVKNKIDFKHISIHKGPEESLGFLLWQISTQWRSSIETVLKLFDLTHPQFVLLATIAWLTREGDLVNQIEVARAVSLDANTVSQVIRSLESKGLIERNRSINEKSKNPLLTPYGSNILSQSLPAVENADALFFNRLTAQELNVLCMLFQKLNMNE